MLERKKKILLTIQRPSDFTEMYRAMEYLNKNNYECIILFYGVGNREADGIVLKQLKTAKERGVVKRTIIKYPPAKSLSKYAKIFPKRFFFMKASERKIKITPEKPEKKKKVKAEIPNNPHKVNFNFQVRGMRLNVKEKKPFFSPQSFSARMVRKIYFYLVELNNALALKNSLFSSVVLVLKKPILFSILMLFLLKQMVAKLARAYLEIKGRLIYFFFSSYYQIKRMLARLNLKLNSFLKILVGKIIQIFLIKPMRFLKRQVAQFRVKKNTIMSHYFTILPFYIINLYVFNNLIKRLEIDIIILPEDIVGFVTPLIIKAGHKNNIPSLIVPYTIANQEEAFQSLKNAEAFNALTYPNSFLGRLCPTWLKKDEHHSVLRLPAAYVIGHLFTGTSPPDPWMMNSGYANAIAVENEAMAEYYLHSGISKKKLQVVGSFCDDDIAKIYNNKRVEKEKIAKELGFDPNKSILLLGGCPNQLIGHPPGFDFANIEEMVEHIVNCLEPLRENYQFIIRPHPNFMELASFFARYDWISTTVDTVKLIPLADIYIAFASATIRWAIACGVPVINYDVFHYDFSEYKQTKGVIHATYPEEFRAAVNQFINNEYVELQKQEIARESKKWGMLDGHSAERIYRLIETLCRLKRVPRIAG